MGGGSPPPISLQKHWDHRYMHCTWDLSLRSRDSNSGPHTCGKGFSHTEPSYWPPLNLMKSELCSLAKSLLMSLTLPPLSFGCFFCFIFWLKNKFFENCTQQILIVFASPPNSSQTQPLLPIHPIFCLHLNFIFLKLDLCYPYILGM